MKSQYFGEFIVEFIREAIFGFSNRGEAARQMALSVGTLMKEGRSMYDAFACLESEIDYFELTADVNSILLMLSQGVEPSQIFKSPVLRMLPASLRVIFASSLSDKLKGELITKWYESCSGLLQLSARLYISLKLFLASIFISGTFWSFVFPQFYEISLNLDVKMPFIIELLLRIGHLGAIFSFVPMLLFLILLILVFAAIIHYFRNLVGRRLVDEVNLMRLLSVAEPEERLMVIDALASPILFPYMHKSLKEFSSLISTGNDICQAAQLAQIDAFQSWFVFLGIVNGAPTELFEHASKMLESKIQNNNKLFFDALLVALVIVQSLFVLMISASTFKLMSLILEGAMM